MSKKQQKLNVSPITITLSIDPALKLNDQGERVMATTIIARRGNIAQLSKLDITNWKQDLPAEVDRLVRLMLTGLELPAFPNMGDATKISSNDEDTPTDEEAGYKQSETVEGLPAQEEPEADEGEPHVNEFDPSQEKPDYDGIDGFPEADEAELIEEETEDELPPAA